MTNGTLLPFSDALKLIHAGKRVRRLSWEPNEFAFLVAGSQFKVNREPLLSILGEGTVVRYRPHLDRAFADGTIGVWTPSHADHCAEDFVEV